MLLLYIQVKVSVDDHTTLKIMEPTKGIYIYF